MEHGGETGRQERGRDTEQHPHSPGDSGTGDRRRARRRWIHRRGALYAGTLHPPGAAPGPGASTRDRPVLARLSTTFGWPTPLPDWAGLAVRIFPSADDAEPAPSGPLDLLLVSSAPEPELWRQMRPSRDLLACTYSTATRLPLGGTRLVASAVPDEPRSATLEDLRTGRAACPVRFRLDVATTRGEWQRLGRLVLEQLTDDDPTVRFRPPEGRGRLVARLRRAVYSLAQS